MNEEDKNIIKKEFTNFGERLYYILPNKKSLNALLILLKELIWDSYLIGYEGYLSSYDDAIKYIRTGIRKASSTKVNPVKEYKHIRPKEYFDKVSFRYKRVGDKLVLIGCRKGKYDKKTHRCKEETKAQKIMQYE